MLSAIGVGIGFVLGNFYASEQIPAVRTNGLHAIVYKGYVTLLIDRTRTSWCDVQPTRVAFQDATVNGETLPMVIPMSAQSLVWPFLGRQ